MITVDWTKNKDLKEKLIDRAENYPIMEIEERMAKVFEKKPDLLKKKNREFFETKFDIYRRKYRARYYVQQHNILLNDDAKDMIKVDIIYKDETGAYVYLLTYFWRNYPMIKLVLSEYFDKLPFLKKEKINVVDVGTGVGTVPLAFSHFIADLNKIAGVTPDVNYGICDSSKKMIEISEELCSSLNIRSATDDLTTTLYLASEPEYDYKYDLITVSYVLSERSYEENVKMLKELIAFLHDDGVLIVVEPFSFTRTLSKITTEVKGERNAIFKTCGSQEKNDYHWDMRNKNDAKKAKLTLEDFDIGSPSFCFSIIGNVDENDFREWGEKERNEQESHVVSGSVLWYWVIPSPAEEEKKKIYELCIAGKNYVGLLYVKEDFMPKDKNSLKEKKIKAIITESKRYDNYEAFYVEPTEESASSEETKRCLIATEEDEKKGVIKGTIKKININEISINSGRYGNLTARWDHRIRKPEGLMRKPELQPGDRVIVFVTRSKGSRFVKYIRKLPHI